MKNLLLVDDERPFLLSLRDGLAALGDRYRIFLANDGREALQVLKTQTIDLLVTDLKLPVMDGFQLLAHVSRDYPYLPVIVMTAFGTPEIEARLARMQNLQYLDKPLDFDHLAQTIETALSTEARSYIRGITLATFMQLVQMEQKSCTLKIHSGDKTGYLFIRRGELLDAVTANAQGEAAALEIIAWDDTTIEMDAVCRREVKSIEASMSFLLMEAYRIKDEAQLPVAGATAPAPVATHIPPVEKDPLLEKLQASPMIDEYAVFDRVNFLEHNSPNAGPLMQSDPTACIDACQKIGTVVGGSFRYLLFSTGNKQRHMVLQQQQRRLVITLHKGAKPEQILETLSPAPFSA